MVSLGAGWLPGAERGGFALGEQIFWSPGAPKGFFAPGRGRVQMKEASPKGLASSGADEARARLAAGKTRNR